MKKIYIHKGSGRCFGSRVIVIASSRAEAETLIADVLIFNNLYEALDIQEMPIKNNEVIYIDTGDY